MAANELVVVQGHDHPLLMKKTLRAAQASWIDGAPEVGKTLGGKTRYRQAAAECALQACSDGEIDVAFAAPQWAVTPGQSVVLYDREVCLGGGIIA
jgi:tRNA-uridine 2-sulfurtransferase